MHQKPTDDLDEQLKSMDPGQLDVYLKENRGYLAEAEKEFYYFVKSVLEKNNIMLKVVYQRMDVEESVGSKIIRQERHTRNRDTIIKICLAGHFSLLETNRALKLYNMRELYAKDPRDACLIVLINNRRFEIDDVDEVLKEKGFEGLMKVVKD